MNRTRCIEVRNAEEVVIFKLYVTENGEAKTRENADALSTPPPKPEGNAPPKENGDPMTEAQRRYLFRIMSGKGLTGEKAGTHLKQLFEVTTLKEVSKHEASDMIERLLAEGKGGDGNGPPF